MRKKLTYIFFGVAASFVLMIASLVCLEFLFRWHSGIKFLETSWPSKFNPDIGFTFQPNSEVKWTNSQDFWAVNYSNSLGFLDREHATDNYDNSCSIAIIGDSFVEAAQVELPDKIQTILEKNLSYANAIVEAFGYSGTGQLNQIPFYRIARQKKRDLVVLVFVSNDFANNHYILETLRNGWDPERPPRLFVLRKNDNFEFIKIDPDWEKYTIPLPLLNSNKNSNYIINNLIKFHKIILDSSALYKKIYLGLYSKYGFIKFLDESNKLSYEDSISYRRKNLLDRGRADWSLGEGDSILTSDLDGKFIEPISPIYKEAVDYTRYALAYIQQMTNQDNTKLVILAASQMGLRQAEGGGALKILKKISYELSIPVIDQYEYVVKNKYDPMAMQFLHDGHWSKLGHITAAKAVEDYVRENKICNKK